jgi:hypothetical protein
MLGRVFAKGVRVRRSARLAGSACVRVGCVRAVVHCAGAAQRWRGVRGNYIRRLFATKQPG